MRSIWMIVIAVAACDSGAPTCKDAVTKARSADEAMSFDAATRLVGKCELKGWTVATRQCIAAAKTRTDLDACTAKLEPERAPVPDAIATMKRFTDEMCMCTTSQCAEKVSNEMTAWSQDTVRSQTVPEKLSDAELEQAKQISDQLASCMQRALTPVPPTHSDPVHKLPAAKTELPF